MRVQGTSTVEYRGRRYILTGTAAAASCLLFPTKFDKPATLLRNFSYRISITDLLMSAECGTKKKVPF